MRGHYQEYMLQVEGIFRNYVEKYPKVYLWGAGRYGRMIKRFLDNRGIAISGYIVTKHDGHDKSFVEGLRVQEWKEVRPKKNIGIILSVSREWHEEIQKLLQKAKLDDPMIPDQTMYRYIGYDNRKLSNEEIDFYKNKYPNKKVKTAKASEWRNILLVCIDNIGDLVMQIPFIRELRRNCRMDAHITLIVQSVMASIVERSGYIDQVIAYEPKSYGGIDARDCEKKNKEFLQRFLPNQKFDAVISMGWYQIRLEQLFLVICADANIRIGYSEKGMKCKEYYNYRWNEFLSLAIDSTGIMHDVERNLQLVSILGGCIHSSNLEMWENEEEKEKSVQFLKKDSCDRLVAIVYHANDPCRMWDMKKYAALIQGIHQRNPDFIFVIMASKRGERAGRDLIKELNLKVPERNILDLIGKTNLGEASSILRCCRLYIGSNTGLLHIAAAWKIPTIEISCHSAKGDPLEVHSPDRYRAWGNQTYIVRPAAPLDGCGATCYRAEAHCINQVTVDQVMSSVEEALNICE